jgi:hypothetical protein
VQLVTSVAIVLAIGCQGARAAVTDPSAIVAAVRSTQNSATTSLE